MQAAFDREAGKLKQMSRRRACGSSALLAF